MKNYLIVIIFSLLTGCAASGPKFTVLMSPKNDQGVLYVYRPYTFTNGGVAPYVYINGKERGELKNQGYLVYPLSAGQYSVATDGSFLTWTPGRAEVLVTIKPGHRSYVRLASHIRSMNISTGLVMTGATLQEVDESLARQELPETRLSVDADEIKATK